MSFIVTQILQMSNFKLICLFHKCKWNRARLPSMGSTNSERTTDRSTDRTVPWSTQDKARRCPCHPLHRGQYPRRVDHVLPHDYTVIWKNVIGRIGPEYHCPRSLVSCGRLALSCVERNNYLCQHFNLITYLIFMFLQYKQR